MTFLSGIRFEVTTLFRETPERKPFDRDEAFVAFVALREGVLGAPLGACS